MLKNNAQDSNIINTKPIVWLTWNYFVFVTLWVLHCITRSIYDTQNNWKSSYYFYHMEDSHHLNDIGSGDYLCHNNLNGPQPHTTILQSKRSNIIWEIVSKKILIVYFSSIRGYQLKHEQSTYLSSWLWLRINIRIITTIIKQPLVCKIQDFRP